MSLLSDLAIILQPKLQVFDQLIPSFSHERVPGLQRQRTGLRNLFAIDFHTHATN
jgi:hypothetical protein